MTDLEIEKRILSAHISVLEEEIRVLTERLFQLKIDYGALTLNPQMISTLMERYDINIH